MKGIDIPDEWERAAEVILRNRWRKVLVLGGIDTGKSTLCGFLSHRFLEAGVDVALVDADIGQKDVGPPAAITLSYPVLPLDLTAIEPEQFYFVGSVTPARHFLPMLVGVQSLVNSSRASFTIINTTGLVRGIGRALKSFKIEAVKPDVIVALERAYELRSITKSHRNHKTIRLKPSAMAEFKTPEQRKLAREHAYSRYLEKASEVTLKIQDIVFQRTLLFSGKSLRDPNFIHIEKTSEGLIGIPVRPSDSYTDVRIIPLGFEQDLLCAVGDWRNTILGLATIRDIDFAEQTVSLFTPIRPEKIRVIQFGDVYVSRDGHELRRKRPEDL